MPGSHGHQLTSRMTNDRPEDESDAIGFVSPLPFQATSYQMDCSLNNHINLSTSPSHPLPWNCTCSISGPSIDWSVFHHQTVNAQMTSKNIRWHPLTQIDIMPPALLWERAVFRSWRHNNHILCWMTANGGIAHESQLFVLNPLRGGSSGLWFGWWQWCRWHVVDGCNSNSTCAVWMVFYMMVMWRLWCRPWVSPPVHPRVRLLMGRAGSHQGTPPTKTIFLTTFSTTTELDTLLMFYIRCPLCKYANGKK